MPMKFLVNTPKMIIAMFCSICFFALTIFLIAWKSWVFALLSLFLCVVYVAVAISNGRVVRVDESGISCRFLSRTQFMSWNDIVEIGVVGLRVVNNKSQKHKGSKNIYFSTTKLSEDELFDMCLEWPPKDKLYCRFSFKRIAAIQKIWTKDIQMYNTGDLHF